MTPDADRQDHEPGRYAGCVGHPATDDLAVPPDAGAASVDEALALVRAHGGRVTSARRLLLAALYSSREHRSAEELAAEVQAQAPDVALSTIYRNLEELERLGVIDRTPLGRGPAAYHLASSAHGHGHFVCEGCDRMIEVPHDLFRGLADTARTHYGFVIDPHRFAVVGSCAECASSA
jgi:Fur family transcriptional regulator, ferric uptake regulator